MVSRKGWRRGFRRQLIKNAVLFAVLPCSGRGGFDPDGAKLDLNFFRGFLAAEKRVGSGKRAGLGRRAAGGFRALLLPPDSPIRA